VRCDASTKSKHPSMRCPETRPRSQTADSRLIAITGV
jgi:hypothetical protein